MRLGQGMLERRVLYELYNWYMSGQLLRRRRRVRPADEQGLDLPAVLLPQLLRRSERIERGLLEMAVGLLADHQNRRHGQTTFASS